MWRVTIGKGGEGTEEEFVKGNEEEVRRRVLKGILKSREGNIEARRGWSKVGAVGNGRMGKRR